MKYVATFSVALLMLFINLSAAPSASAGPGAPSGWFVAGAKPNDYEFGTEHVEGSEGKQSAYIKAKPGATTDGFGTLMQRIKADNYIGQRLRVSARLKSDSVDQLHLWFRIDGADNKPLRFNNTPDQPVSGTSDWKRYSIVFDVPPGSTSLNYGFFLLGGKGEGWADSFVVERVNKDVLLSTDQDAPSPIYNNPTNLNFDQ